MRHARQIFFVIVIAHAPKSVDTPHQWHNC